MEGEATLALVIERSELYDTWQLFWFSIHYLAGLLAIIAGGLATASVTDKSPSWITRFAWVWGLTASLLTGVVTFLGPLQKAETYKQAHYVLEKGAVEYRDKLIDLKSLSMVLEQGQQIVLQGSMASSTSAVKE